MSRSGDGFETRLRRLEDRHELRALRYRYCYAIDVRDWDGLVELFTENASLDYGGIGAYEGHDGVREFATEFVEENLAATAHAMHNPVLEIDGDTATGKWYVSAPITYADGSGGFRWGWYDERYERVDGDWLIDDLRMRYRYAVDYDDGWPDLEIFTPE